MPDKQWLKIDLLLHLDALYYSVPAQNALLSYLLSYSRHGSYGANELHKRYYPSFFKTVLMYLASIGMKIGDVLITHRKIRPWMNKNFGQSRHSLR
jgi:hypothetical protein